MLKKSRKIKKEDLSSLFRNGKSVSTGYFSLKFLYGVPGQSAFAVIVGKKLASSAVVRNRIKRRVYDSLSTLYGRIPKPVYAAVFPKNEAQNLKGEALHKELALVLKKSGIIV